MELPPSTDRNPRLALKPGCRSWDEVIVPGLTFTTAASVLDVNATLILADIDPDTFNIDPKAIEAAITTRTNVLYLSIFTKGSRHGRNNVYRKKI